MIDMKKALQNIDDVIEKGPYKGRHFHPLGRVQRAGV